MEELVEIIKGVVIAIVILGLAVYGGIRVRELLRDFVRKFGVEEEPSKSVGLLAQYIIWIVGAGYFLRALPIGIEEIGYFITSALYHVLLGCLIVGVFLLGIKIKGGEKKNE